jgi:hypothetical protein
VSYQAGDPVSWIGTAARFDRPIIVDRAWTRRGIPLYDLRDESGTIVIFAARETELMPAIQHA